MFLLVKLKRKKKHIKTAYLVKKNVEKNKGCMKNKKNGGFHLSM